MVNAQRIDTQEINEMGSLRRLTQKDRKLALDGMVGSPEFVGVTIVQIPSRVDQKDHSGIKWGQPEFFPPSLYGEVETQKPLYAADANAYFVGKPTFMYGVELTTRDPDADLIHRVVDIDEGRKDAYAHYPVTYFKIEVEE